MWFKSVFKRGAKVQEVEGFGDEQEVNDFARADARAGGRADYRADDRIDDRAYTDVDGRADYRTDDRIDGRTYADVYGRADYRTNARTNARTDDRADDIGFGGSEPEEVVSRGGFLHKLIMWTRNVLTGDILSKSEVKRHYPYVAFLLVLALLYITHIFSVQELHREHASLTKEVKDLRAKSLTMTSYRMQATRYSNIIKTLKERGSKLEESLTPNIVIAK